jgi:hypothetical protein
MRINAARGLLREFGIVFATGAATLPEHVQAVIEDADAAVPMLLRDLLHQLVLEIGELESRVKTVENQLEALASQTPVVQRAIRKIRGHRRRAGRQIRVAVEVLCRVAQADRGIKTRNRHGAGDSRSKSGRTAD